MLNIRPSFKKKGKGKEQEERFSFKRKNKDNNTKITNTLTCKHKQVLKETRKGKKILK